MKVRSIALLPAVAAALLLFAGCSALDVVGRAAVTTFQVLLDRAKNAVAFDGAAGRFKLTSPGGERFEWSADFSAATPDFSVAFDATTYLEAGLDPARLPATRYAYDPATRQLTLSFEVGNSAFSFASGPTALESFKKIVETNRPIIGYHEALDHYGIALGDGNMFEWAKDMVKNDKDMVFVLDPEPLRAAGVDPAKVTGWIFTKIPVKDSTGKTVEVDKFVKPYDLPTT